MRMLGLPRQQWYKKTMADPPIVCVDHLLMSNLALGNLVFATGVLGGDLRPGYICECNVDRGVHDRPGEMG